MYLIIWCVLYIWERNHRTITSSINTKHNKHRKDGIMEEHTLTPFVPFLSLSSINRERYSGDLGLRFKKCSNSCKVAIIEMRILLNSISSLEAFWWNYIISKYIIWKISTSFSKSSNLNWKTLKLHKKCIFGNTHPLRYIVFRERGNGTRQMVWRP